jgi:hypothetical protein
MSYIPMYVRVCRLIRILCRCMHICTYLDGQTVSEFAQIIDWRHIFATSISSNQGCQIVYFQTKKPNMDKFWRVLRMEKVGIFFGHLVHFMAIRYLFWPFSNLVDNLVHSPPLRFGIWSQEKSDNPANNRSTQWIQLNAFWYVFDVPT